MRRRRAVLFWVSLILMGLHSPPALAGAWPREKGAVFLSFSSSIEASTSSYLAPVHSLYAEYGLDGRLTLGFDGFYDTSDGSSQALAFLSVPVGRDTGPDRFMLSFGLGQKKPAAGDADAALRLGATWGRGLNNGWFSLEAQALATSADPAPDLKAEATWGINRPSGAMMILQVTAERPDDSDAELWVSPSYVWNATDQMQMQLGLSGEASGGNEVRLKLGTWLSF